MARACPSSSSLPLAELAALKADFTAMVGHELSAPVAAIRGLAAMLASGKLDDEGQARAIDAVRSEIGVVATLVSDVRAAAALERTEFDVRPRRVPVAALLGDALAFARTLPGERRIGLAIAAPEAVLADPERIGQVLRNLIGNAAKYTPEDAPIELRATANGSRVRIAVADRGPGIPAEDLTRIFEKFGRGRDVGGHGVPGVGLGLYLSRRIARAHGGDLRVQTAPGEGSVFSFDLEVAE
jgi:signal transduction histidine kinase